MKLISIIIPALNEAQYIAGTLDHLLELEGHFEIIVVDGGSRDATPALAAQYDAVKVLAGPKGRASQMNAGAQAAAGEVLLFLHADTLLPGGAYNSILEHLQHSSNIGGSFMLRLDNDQPFFKFYTWCSQWSLEFFTYGDHGIFVKREVFWDIGGYKDLPFMEDVEIQNRLRTAGKFRKLKIPVLTSARRFEKMGVMKQLVIDVLLVFFFKAGVSPVKLKRFYRDHC